MITHQWGRLLKLLVTIILLGLVLWITPLSTTYEAICNAEPAWLVAALLLFLSSTWIQALRAKVLLDEPDLPLTMLFKIQLIGTAAGFFLPSSLAGDVARTTLLARREGLLEKSILSTIASRILGLGALMSLALLGALFWTGENLALRPGTSMLSAGVFSLLAIGAIWFTWKRLRRKEEWWRNGPAWKQRIFNGFSYIDGTLRNPRILCLSILLSLLLQGSTLTAGWCLFMAAQAEVQISTVYALLPLVQLGSLAPLSLGGLGIREGLTMALFHGIAGLPRAICMAVMTLGYSTSVVLSIPGVFLFYPTWRMARSKKPLNDTEATDA